MANLASTPSARIFLNSAKLRPGKSPAERRLQQTHWRKCHHLLIRMHLKCNIAQHFAANRGSQCAPKAELWQIKQAHPQRAFSEILQSCDKGKVLQKEGHKKHPGANVIIF